MTRGLHTDTKIQRGNPDAVSATARARGYEASDAPPKGVAWGVSAFVALMIIGLLFAMPVVLLINRGLPPPEPAHSDRPPPTPRLLVDPSTERARIEAAQAARLRHIDEAMRRVAELGWQDDASAPDAEQTAREHAEALQ